MKKADPWGRLFRFDGVDPYLNHEALRHALAAVGEFEKVDAVVQIEVQLRTTHEVVATLFQDDLAVEGEHTHQGVVEVGLNAHKVLRRVGPKRAIEGSHDLDVVDHGIRGVHEHIVHVVEWCRVVPEA